MCFLSSFNFEGCVAIKDSLWNLEIVVKRQMTFFGKWQIFEISNILYLKNSLTHSALFVCSSVCQDPVLLFCHHVFMITFHTVLSFICLSSLPFCGYHVHVYLHAWLILYCTLRHVQVFVLLYNNIYMFDQGNDFSHQYSIDENVQPGQLFQ